MAKAYSFHIIPQHEIPLADSNTPTRNALRPVGWTVMNTYSGASLLSRFHQSRGRMSRDFCVEPVFGGWNPPYEARAIGLEGAAFADY